MSSESDPTAGGRVDSGAVANRYRSPIYRYILRLVSDPERAQDLTQETLLRVHERLEGLKDPAALEAWVYRVATNVCYDFFRRREYRLPELPLPTLDEEEQTNNLDEEVLRPDQLLEQSEMSDCVVRFLTQLPESQREALILHDLQGFTGPEIAERLGLSLHNVKIRVHRARARLKAALSQGCVFSRDDRGVPVCEPKPKSPPE